MPTVAPIALELRALGVLAKPGIVFVTYGVRGRTFAKWHVAYLVSFALTSVWISVR